MPLTKKEEKKIHDNETRIKELDKERDRLCQENKKIRYGRLDDLMGKYYKKREDDGSIELICPDYHCSNYFGNDNVRELHGIVLRSCLTTPYQDITYFEYDELGKVDIIANPYSEDFHKEFLKQYKEITKKEFYSIIRQEYNKFAKRVLEEGNDDNTAVEDTRKED